MAEVMNCEKCGRMFQSVASVKKCGRCRTSDDDLYKVVREYIYDNPGATVPECSEATDVPEKKILKFLREGRLETKGDAMLINCEKCEEPIASGKFCDKCTQEMTQGLRDVAKQIQESVAPSNEREKKVIGKGMYTQLRK